MSCRSREPVYTVQDGGGGRGWTLLSSSIKTVPESETKQGVTIYMIVISECLHLAPCWMVTNDFVYALCYQKSPEIVPMSPVDLKKCKVLWIKSILVLILYKSVSDRFVVINRSKKYHIVLM